MKILAVIVNYGVEQIEYLDQLICSLKSFNNYKVHVVLHSNIDINIDGIDEIKIFKLNNYKLLPSTCRKTIWENKDLYDLFYYSENDLLVKEIHFDKHLKYENILPKNRISGLIQFEYDGLKKYFPAYHGNFDWKYNSIEYYGDKVFAHFKNLHQGSFIVTNRQLNLLGAKFNFNELVEDKIPITYKIKKKFFEMLNKKIDKYYIYDDMCKTCTDLYQYGGMKKLICISDFEDNLIHHMPNIYINGDKGRKKLRSEQLRMDEALKKMLS